MIGMAISAADAERARIPDVHDRQQGRGVHVLEILHIPEYLAGGLVFPSLDLGSESI